MPRKTTLDQGSEQQSFAIYYAASAVFQYIDAAQLAVARMIGTWSHEGPHPPNFLVPQGQDHVLCLLPHTRARLRPPCTLVLKIPMGQPLVKKMIILAEEPRIDLDLEKSESPFFKKSQVHVHLSKNRIAQYRGEIKCQRQPRVAELNLVTTGTDRLWRGYSARYASCGSPKRSHPMPSTPHITTFCTVSQKLPFQKLRLEMMQAVSIYSWRICLCLGSFASS